MLRIDSAIGQQRIAKPADGGGHNIQLIINLAIGGEAFVLNDHRHIVDAPLFRQAQFANLVIFNQHQPGKAHRHLAPGFAVFVRMNPAGRGALLRRKRHRTGSACGNNPLRTAVDDAWNLQTMPVKRRVFGQLVMDINGHAFSFVKLYRWPQQITVVAPGCRVLTGECGLSGFNN
ncbi:Uncharacterised protein [Salmonella enterica subsp. enterica serovar Bovismorbificans]|nr:Uncharacterised protein [Salmonella enterica subsp. enterica serovar Bovismorbificans]